MYGLKYILIFFPFFFSFFFFFPFFFSFSLASLGSQPPCRAALPYLVAGQSVTCPPALSLVTFFSPTVLPTPAPILRLSLGTGPLTGMCRRPALGSVPLPQHLWGFQPTGVLGLLILMTWLAYLLRSHCVKPPALLVEGPLASRWAWGGSCPWSSVVS